MLDHLSVDPAKIDVISSLPYPSSVREVHSFLGHAGFYRRFIKDFSKVALPLFRLLQKDVEFELSADCKEEFDKLKTALTQAPIVRGPDWSQPFEIMCDASNYAVGAALAHRDGKDPFVIRCGADQIIRRCVPLSEFQSILEACHSSDSGGHFGPQRTARKILDCRFWFGNISKRDEMPQQSMLFCKNFDVWDIDFMGPFPNSNGFVYVLNHIICRFGSPRVIVSDQGTHFCNRKLTGLLKKHSIIHKIATTYHPQTNGQSEVSNREIKHILQKIVKPHRKDWSTRLVDAL
ncbi:uncharacterized protein LOC130974903 [Arachis stenosperma]|uniref:uncharacterized protein LOC130974903 n=1 Tax=Arachis stenosperma TaxID=217475 RepID=UPI0025AB9CF5|nr:uncharacterized protein LOC130974903 [Arachis stenosperma]